MNDSLKQRIRLSIDANTWDEIQRRLPNTDLTIIVNELLYQFLGVLVESETDFPKMMRTSADLAVERLDQSRILPERSKEDAN